MPLEYSSVKIKTATLYETISYFNSLIMSITNYIMLSFFCIKLKTESNLSILIWSIWFALAGLLEISEDPDSERFSLPLPIWENPPCFNVVFDY